MELMIQWFWLIKLSVTLLIIWVYYKAFIVNDFKSKLWNILAGTMCVLTIIQPFKLDVDTKSQTQYVNNQIEKSKVLPTTLMDSNVPVIVNTK